MKSTGLLLILILMPVSSCVSIQRLDDPVYYEKNATWKYNFTKEICYKASLKALKNMRYSVREQEEKTGRIITDPKPVRAFTYEYDEKGKIAGERSLGYQASLDISIRPDGSRCIVGINRLRLYMKNDPGLIEKNEEATGFVNHRIGDFKRSLEIELRMHK